MINLFSFLSLALWDIDIYSCRIIFTLCILTLNWPLYSVGHFFVYVITLPHFLHNLYALYIFVKEINPSKSKFIVQWLATTNWPNINQSHKPVIIMSIQVVVFTSRWSTWMCFSKRVWCELYLPTKVHVHQCAILFFLHWLFMLT